MTAKHNFRKSFDYQQALQKLSAQLSVEFSTENRNHQFLANF